MRKALYRFNFQCSIVNHLHTPSLPATFTQSNNNNVANQVQRLHFSVFFRLSAAKVHISHETTKQFVTFFALLVKNMSLLFVRIVRRSLLHHVIHQTGDELGWFFCHPHAQHHHSCLSRRYSQRVDTIIILPVLKPFGSVDDSPLQP